MTLGVVDLSEVAFVGDGFDPGLLTRTDENRWSLALASLWKLIPGLPD